MYCRDMIRRGAMVFMAGVIAVTLFYPIGAWAQLDEMVVTARKREESLQDVPLSIAVFSIQELQDRNIANIYDIAAVTPNFTMAPNIGRRLDAPTVRGQDTPSIGSTESNAAFFIDGVYVTQSVSRTSIEALERVEVLRGPQSAVFGRAAFSGAINFITRQPSNEFEGEFNGRVATHDNYKASGWLSGPIIEDKLLFLLSGAYQTSKGEWRNHLPENAPSGFGAGDFTSLPLRADNSRLGGEETWDVTGKLSFRPIDGIELNIKGSYAESFDDHFPALIVEVEDLNCFVPGVDPDADPGSPGWFCGELTTKGRVSRINLPDFVDGVTRKVDGDLVTALPVPFLGSDSETYRFLAEAIIDFGFLDIGNLDFSGWELITRYSRNEDDNNFMRDLDRTEGRGLFNRGNFHVFEDDRSDDYSWEVRLSSPQDKRFRGSVGTYYFISKASGRDRRFTDVRTDSHLFGDFSLQSPDKNKAIFGYLEWDVLSNLTLSFEGRYAQDFDSIDSNNGIKLDQKFKSFTPRTTLTYEPTDDLMFYALAAKGFKPGGTNGQFFSTNVPQQFSFDSIENGRAIIEPETAWTYEAGTKSQWFGGNLRLNVSLYYIDWTNQQIQITTFVDQVDNMGNPDAPLAVTAIDAAGESRVYGTEIEATITPTDNLTLNFAYGLADTKLKSFNSDDFAALTGIDDFDLVMGGNVSGNESPSSPKHSGNFTGMYRNQLWGDLDWFLRTDYTYETKRWATPMNLAHTGDRHLWNARIGIDGEHWSLSSYVDNILDDKTATRISSFPYFAISGFPTLLTLTPQRGTNFGLSVQLRL